MGHSSQTALKVKEANIWEEIYKILDEEDFVDTHVGNIRLTTLPKASSEKEAIKMVKEKGNAHKPVAYACPYDHAGKEVFIVYLIGKV